MIAWPSAAGRSPRHVRGWEALQTRAGGRAIFPIGKFATTVNTPFETGTRLRNGLASRNLGSFGGLTCPARALCGVLFWVEELTPECNTTPQHDKLVPGL